MKKHFTIIIRCFVFLLFFLSISISGFSQNAGISAASSAPNASAGLDVNFTNKGMLFPRVILTSTITSAPLAAHIAGMIVYNTATTITGTNDVKPGPYYNNGTKWIPILLNGSTAGMQYWNGTAWVAISPGTVGQRLQLNVSNVPTWAP